MGRLADIILKARYVLRDDGDRYTDASLLQIIDDAQKEIVKSEGLLRYKEQVAVLAAISSYTLASNALTIDRATDKNGLPIGFASHSTLDAKSMTWETDTGSTIESIVIDKQYKDSFIIYPVPVENYGNIHIYGSLAPTAITNISDELSISTNFDRAVRYYAIAASLRNNHDKVSLKLGGVFYGFYTAQLKLIRSITSINSVKKIRCTSYGQSA